MFVHSRYSVNGTVLLHLSLVRLVTRREGFVHSRYSVNGTVLLYFSPVRVVKRREGFVHYRYSVNERYNIIDLYTVYYTV